MTDAPRKWTADRIYQNLRQGIMTLELYPGSRVTETELAQRFGVSRTPVREALRQTSKAMKRAVGIPSKAELARRRSQGLSP